MPGLRILQAITPSQIGGAEVHVITLSEKLQERGHRITIFCPKRRALCSELRARDLEVWSPSTTGKIDPITLWRIRRFLARHQIDILHTHLSTASLLGGLAGRWARVPTVATVHGLNTKTCFTFSQRVIAVSQAVKQHLVKQGMDPGKIEVVYNGIDLNRFARADGGGQFRQAWGLPADAIILGTMGRLGPEKGHQFLLRAIAELEHHPRAQLVRVVIVGEGQERDRLESLSHQLGISDRVIFTGFQRDVLPALSAMDIFVLPSLKEGLSISALEAMALGNPVIACRVGGTPEVVVEGKTGILVPPADPQRLAEAVSRLLSDRGQALIMGQAGRQQVARLFDVEVMVGKIEHLYHDLLGKK